MLIPSQIATADIENRGAIIIGLENIENMVGRYFRYKRLYLYDKYIELNIVGRCAIYERLYLHGIDIESALVESLEKALVDLYADILIYLSRSKRYYPRNAAGRSRPDPPKCSC